MLKHKSIVPERVRCKCWGVGAGKLSWLAHPVLQQPHHTE